MNDLSIEAVIKENQRLRTELEGATIATVLLLQKLGGKAIFSPQDLMAADDPEIRVISEQRPEGDVIIKIEETGLVLP